MTKSKTHFIKQLCSLKQINIDSEEAHGFLNKSVVELLTMIKELKGEPEQEWQEIEPVQAPESEPEPQAPESDPEPQAPESEPEPQEESDDESDDETFAHRCGSRFR